jgi:hypothetical protein
VAQQTQAHGKRRIEASQFDGETASETKRAFEGYPLPEVSLVSPHEAARGKLPVATPDLG